MRLLRSHLATLLLSAARVVIRLPAKLHPNKKSGEIYLGCTTSKMWGPFNAVLVEMGLSPLVFRVFSSFEKRTSSYVNNSQVCSPSVSNKALNIRYVFFKIGKRCKNFHIELEKFELIQELDYDF